MFLTASERLAGAGRRLAEKINALSHRRLLSYLLLFFAR